MSRLELSDTVMTAASKLSDGNPGAINVMVRVFQAAPTVDPQMGGLGPLVLLDTYGIYGSRIWMLYKDACGQDIVMTIAMLRACQMGIISRNTLRHAIENRGAGLDTLATLKLLKEQLPTFDPETPASSTENPVAEDKTKYITNTTHP